MYSKNNVISGAEVLGELRNLMLEENGEDKITNEEVFERIGEKRTLLNNIPRRKANWIGHILRRDCLLREVIEGQMMSRKNKNTASC